MSWTAPEQRRRQLDHWLHGHAVRRRATAQSPIQVNSGSATSTPSPGLTNGTTYTFTVKAINSAGTSPASPPSSRGHSGQHDLRLLGPPSPSTPAMRQSTELGVKFTADVERHVTGLRFYKAAGQHRHAYREPLDRRRQHCWPRRRSRARRASGWQTVTFSQPVAITAGTTYVAAVLRTQTATTRRRPAGFELPVDNPPLHALANSTSANGVYAYSDDQHVPDEHLQRQQLLGRRPVPAAPRTPRPASHQRRRHARLRQRDRHVDGALERRQSDHQLHGHPLHRLHRPDSDDDQRLAAGRRRATVNGLTNGSSYTFTVKATNANGTGAASVGRHERGDPWPQPGGQWSSLHELAARRDPLVLSAHRQRARVGRLASAGAVAGVRPGHATFTNPINSPDGIFCSGDGAAARRPDSRRRRIRRALDRQSRDRRHQHLRPVDRRPGRESPTCTTRAGIESLTELGDGRYVAISGKSTDFGTWADTPEVYDPSTIRGRCSRTSRPRRSTSWSTRTPTCSPTATCSSSGPRKTIPSS